MVMGKGPPSSLVQLRTVKRARGYRPLIPRDPKMSCHAAAAARIRIATEPFSKSHC